jgi:hypothetical protein
MLELKDNPTQKEISKAWPDISIDGDDVFSIYLDATKVAEDKIRDISVIQDLQEAYLGYNPEKEEFVIGFDAWFSDGEFGSATATIMIEQEGFQILRTTIHLDPLYGKNGIYENLAPLHLRLD